MIIKKKQGVMPYNWNPAFNKSPCLESRIILLISSHPLAVHSIPEMYPWSQ